MSINPVVACSVVITAPTTGATSAPQRARAPPERALFDKTWELADVEKVKQ